MHTVSADSPAKINLTLRVLAKRPDGYHEIESLITQVDLCDTVTVSATGRAIRVTCDEPSIPTDESNLAHRAAQALLGPATQAGIQIDLLKRIPAGAGLGGGSSNAATVLRLANDLLGSGFSVERLAEIGRRLGADIPLFLHGSPCIVRGVGDRIESLSRPIPGWVTIVMPPIHCDTQEIYEAWSACERVEKRPSAARLSSLYRTAGELMPRLYNDLEPAAVRVRPELAHLHEDLCKLAGAPVRMTGSGSAFFRLVDDEADARLLAEQVGRVLDIPVVTAALRPRPPSDRCD